ncbi:MAG: 30S ribosomal protein S9 [Myxococcota bacterium]|nr:30S ribosomal protein S9 [Myxococcota bacterium]
MESKRWEATGRRKTSSARVRLVTGSGRFFVNGREDAEFFRRASLQMIVRRPFEITDTSGQFDVHANVKGGGLTGAAGAIKHGLSRALCEYDPELRGALKRAGFLTRDSRMKERKKPGLKGARARFQFSKR